jgi:hypothetical protein
MSCVVISKGQQYRSKLRQWIMTHGRGPEYRAATGWSGCSGSRFVRLPNRSILSRLCFGPTGYAGTASEFTSNHAS